MRSARHPKRFSSLRAKRGVIISSDEAGRACHGVRHAGPPYVVAIVADVYACEAHSRQIADFTQYPGLIDA